MLNIAKNPLRRAIIADLTNDKLPFEHSPDDVPKIYLNRFLVLLIVVLFNFLLLGIAILISQ